MKEAHRKLFAMEEELWEREARSHSGTGDTFFRQNDYGNAIMEYTRAIKLDGAAVYYANRGNCYFKKKSWTKALADYCEALYREPQNKTYQDYVAAGQEKMTRPKLWLTAIECSDYVFASMPENLKTADFCSAVLMKDGNNLVHIPESLKTFELCRIAVKQNGSALQFVPETLHAQVIEAARNEKL
jgi:tetratricopeptide (TPR) repeat protein